MNVQPLSIDKNTQLASLKRALEARPGQYGVGMDSNAMKILYMEKAREFKWGFFDPELKYGDAYEISKALNEQPAKNGGLIVAPVWVFADQRDDYEALQKTLRTLAALVAKHPNKTGSRFKTIIIPIGAGDHTQISIDHNILLVLQKHDYSFDSEWNAIILDQLGENDFYAEVKEIIKLSLPPIFKKHVFENNSQISESHNDCATVCSYLVNEIHDGKKAIDILSDWVEDDTFKGDGGFLNSADFGQKRLLETHKADLDKLRAYYNNLQSRPQTFVSGAAVNRFEELKQRHGASGNNMQINRYKR